ncbi:uncharacterized protein L201_007047 [Kwoniella dendrophila CBS 6074]|uniref:Uncharacterized protein n=1 Tax=Kwoniella dendrophila CBS 6074 TaxID=1295534 RepID=A0AAX4K4I3_9TREE
MSGKFGSKNTTSDTPNEGSKPWITLWKRDNADRDIEQAQETLKTKIAAAQHVCRIWDSDKTRFRWHCPHTIRYTLGRYRGSLPSGGLPANHVAQEVIGVVVERHASLSANIGSDNPRPQPGIP